MSNYYASSDAARPCKCNRILANNVKAKITCEYNAPKYSYTDNDLRVMFGMNRPKITAIRTKIIETFENPNEYINPLIGSYYRHRYTKKLIEYLKENIKDIIGNE